jgi:phosphoserine phosphatase RsbU/P
MIDKSIAYRISFYISVSVILVFVSFIIVNYLFNQRLLREHAENKAIGLSLEVSTIINRRIVTVKEVTAGISDQIIYYSRNGDVEELLKQITDKYPYLVSVEIYYDSAYMMPYNFYSLVQKNSHLVYQYQKTHHFSSPTEKEHYKNAVNAVSPQWTLPYIWIENGEVVVSYVHPITAEIKGEAGTVGYISSRMSLAGLNDAINTIKIGKRGYAFIIDENGNYLTHPDKRKIFAANLYTVSSKVLNRKDFNFDKIFKEREKVSVIAYPDILNYEKSWTYFSPVPETRWYLLFVMPYRELYGELIAVTFRMTIFALFGIILIYFLVSYITRKQIEPLTHVTSRLTSISSPFRLNTKNEVKQVANSLEYLNIWFEQYQIARETEELNNHQHYRDLQQASEIQQSLIKNSYPAFPTRSDISLHALYKPAQVVSGDLFDYYFIDDSNLVFTIGDVSGKGIPAAIFMSVCQTVIKNNSGFKQPRKIVEKTNFELSKSNHHQYFLTLFLGVLNVKSGELAFCNAAHTFPFILKQNGEITELQSTHGLPLGLYSEKLYEDEQIQLEYGDSIVLYTDGVYDALVEKDILSGSRWFKRKLGKMKDYEPNEITGFIDNEISKSEYQLKDDVCLLVIKYTP